jgi:hypothetical protein
MDIGCSLGSSLHPVTSHLNPWELTTPPEEQKPEEEGGLAEPLCYYKWESGQEAGKGHKSVTQAEGRGAAQGLHREGLRRGQMTPAGLGSLELTDSVLAGAGWMATIGVRGKKQGGSPRYTGQGPSLPQSGLQDNTEPRCDSPLRT